MYKKIFIFLMSFTLAHSSFSDNVEGSLSSLDLYKLGYQFEVGIDQEADQAKAHTYYQKAATKGYSEAQYKLGRLYYSGDIDGKADFAKAFDWFSKAAEQEHSAANWAIGYMYEFGSGRDKNAKEAFSWYLKSAEFGYKDAQVSVAGMYLSGIGIEKDPKKSFDWYLKAAFQGDQWAQ